MSFSADSAVLAVGSSTGTVHVFDVESALRRLVLMASPPPPPPSSSQAGETLAGGRTSSGAESQHEAGAGGGGTWTSSAMSYLSKAQSWGVAAVGGLGQAVLPEPVQEYAESIRCVTSSCHNSDARPHNAISREVMLLLSSDYAYCFQYHLLCHRHTVLPIYHMFIRYVMMICVQCCGSCSSTDVHGAGWKFRSWSCN
jgi:hypothetical protein